MGPAAQAISEDLTIHALQTGLAGNSAQLYFDRNSLAVALLLGIAVGLLAYSSMAISLIDGPIATIWLPNAVATSILLFSAVRSIKPALAAMFVASSLANLAFGFPVNQAVTLAIANTVEVTLAVLSMRAACQGRPDMTNIRHLGQFILCGGILAPLASAGIASIGLSAGGSFNWLAGLSWFVTDSLGQILITPTLLMLADAIGRKDAVSSNVHRFEFAAIFGAGTVTIYVVFAQTAYQLLFLIPPIVVLHAFRFGSLGAALFILQLTIIATVKSKLGFGPIAPTVDSVEAKLLLIQAFVAANALTGLPVAAILTSRQKTFKSLVESRRELALLTSTITDAVLRIDKSGKCVYASPSVREVLGAGPEEFVGKRPLDRVHPETQKEFTATFMRLLNGEIERERLTYRHVRDHDDGRAAYLDTQAAIAYNPDTGEADGFVASLRDVTEQIELEEELVLARKRAEQAAEAKSAFLANMSHELRTPMNGLIGFADLLLQSELDREQRRYAELIVKSGRSMMLLLNDILDLSKVEAGKLAINIEPVNIASVIEASIGLYRTNAQEKGIELKVELSPHIPLVSTDKLRLQQVLINLVDNAVKFTNSGSVTVGAEHVGTYISIRVTDTGIGIDQSKQQNIFSPFEQVEGHADQQSPGTGLGLSICRELVELLGGDLELRSTPDCGSTFIVILPLVAKDSEQASSPSTLDQKAAPPEGSKILLAEDNEINMLLIHGMLKQCGQEVHLAKNGDEAVVMVLDAAMRGDPFDLVFMDIQMPECDGYSATRMIREEGITAQELPIIALTANAFPDDVLNSRNAGMQAHLAKPIEYKEIVAALQRWLPTRIIDHSIASPLPLSDGSEDRTII